MKNTNIGRRNDNLLVALRIFATTIYGKFSAHITGEPEDQLRSPFETFIVEVGNYLNIPINVVGEILLDDRLGRPDFGIATNGLPCGYVELKAPGKGADPDKYKGHDKRQWERFKSLPNIIYTDGIEWALFRSGITIRTVRLTGDPRKIGPSAIGENDADLLLPLLSDFFNWEPIVPTTAKQLALYLAPLCRMLKDDVLDALDRGSESMSGVARDWRRYLFPDADNAKFADSYAQTVTFALLLARSSGADTLFLDQSVIALTAKNTLLGRALQVLTDDEVRADVGPALNMLQRVIQVIPSKTMTHGKHDPWLHFYEDFLQEYDPKLRKDAGAYYTPLEVVHAQVALVDDILRKKLDKPMGFAEGGVTTLDPAVGTGTYLLAIVEHAMKRVAEVEGPGAVRAQASLLAQSLYGFEIMVGPYAVAALRMTRLLQDFGGGIPADGVQIFLNNTLESPNEVMPELPMMYRAIGLEHQRAKRVKESVTVLVCIGNPPYDRHEKATVDNKMSTGAWVRWGEALDGKGAIFEDFIAPVKRAKKGGQLKSLYNLYSYFWRWGLWKVFEGPFAQTGGVVSFITASSFLEGDAFIGMRRKMRELCDEIWIIDLGGDNRGTRRDENVFTIQTPVAIAIAIRANQASPSIPAKVNYTRIEGSKAEKLKSLSEISSLDGIGFEDCQADWDSPFIPKNNNALYFKWPKLTDLMPWQHSGVQFKRSWPIAPTENLLKARWAELANANNAMKKDLFRETGYRTILTKTTDLNGNALSKISDFEKDEVAPSTKRYGFRSFDRQYAMADNRLCDRLRPPLWLSFSKNQIYFSSLTTSVIAKGPALTASPDVPDLHYFRGSYGAKDIIPLYRDTEGLQPNIHPELLLLLSSLLEAEIDAEDWACYLYAVLAHPEYSEIFSEELLSKDVRIPITFSKELFFDGVNLGKYLLYLHSFGERFADDFPLLTGSAKCLRAVQEDMPTNTYSYSEDRQILLVGTGEFGRISREIWEFEVSGLKVLQSWLGYRMEKRFGKKTSPLDLIGPAHWTAELTTELLRLLWLLENTLLQYPKQRDLLNRILLEELIQADSIGEVLPAFRKAPISQQDQDELEL